MPKIDERVATQRHHHGFMLIQDPERPYLVSKFNFNSVGHHDFERGTTEAYYAGDGCGFQEPVFVPRGPGAPEGDGYLLLIRNKLVERASELLVLDVADLNAGPVPSVAMPVR